MCEIYTNLYYMIDNYKNVDIKFSAQDGYVQSRKIGKPNNYKNPWEQKDHRYMTAHLLS
jgi:hypothetical protein